MKTLDITSAPDAAQKVPDIKVFGADLWKLLCKASSAREGWMKSTKAMDTPEGALVQVTTQQLNADGTYSIAEALAYVPGVYVSDLQPNGGRELLPYERA